MLTSPTTLKRSRGHKLSFDEKIDLIEAIAEVMNTEGIVSVLGLAQRLEVNTTTIIRYKPYAERIFNKTKVNDRTFHRNLLIQRTYMAIEQMAILRDNTTKISDLMSIHNQMIKYQHLLAVVTGIIQDAKAQPTEQRKPLVIIRPAQQK